MVRHPHTAVISVNSGSKDSNGDFIDSIAETIVKGRFEPKVGGSLDFAGKFYCKLLDFEPFQIFGQKLKYNGIEMEIFEFHNYQNHCELWLK